MKKILLSLGLSLSLSFGMNNTVVSQKQVLITKLKKIVEEDIKHVHNRKGVKLKNVKVGTNKITFIYDVNITKEKLKKFESKKHVLKTYLEYKLKLAKQEYKKINKKDPLLILILKYKYNIEYQYCLMNDKNTCMKIYIPAKEIIN